MTDIRTAPVRQVGELGGAPMLLVADAAGWEAWLAHHHDEPAGAWLLIAKRGSRERTVTQPEALDGALCFGWIDSTRRAFDGDFYLQRYSSRRRGSVWSLINARRVEELAAAGRLRAPGHAEVELAKATGRFPSVEVRAAS